jgi:HK97 family phage prohead protease
VELSHKNARVEAKAINDVEGTVEAVVSVTNIVDNVNDVIEPGAYIKTLGKRIPKGVWSHDTTIPVARTLSAVELMPGDERLPAHLQEVDAGGVLVKMQFNLNTTRGREAYEDIKFFGHEQEWSIGYSVPEGESEMKAETGVRHIKSLEWYEYSPVLFGAAPGTKTVSVKEIPVEAKETEETELKGPIKSHAVGFDDDRPWKAAMYKNVRSPADKEYYSDIFAFHKDGEDPDYKTNYSFIHHYVGSDGRAGAAALGGLREGIGSLNGARGGTILRGSDRKGVYNHLARHYREGGETPLDLKSDEYLDSVMELKASLSGFEYEEIDSLIFKGAEINEIKSLLEDTMADNAETIETTEAEVAPETGGDLQSILSDAMTALNTLSARLGDLEEKGGDVAGFSNTDADSAERADGAGEDAPDAVANLSHGGDNTAAEMTEAGTPAGNAEDAPAPAPAPKKAPKAKKKGEDEKADEVETEVTEVEAEEAKAEEVEAEAVETVDELSFKELQEFHTLLSFSDLGE